MMTRTSRKLGRRLVCCAAPLMATALCGCNRNTPAPPTMPAAPSKSIFVDVAASAGLNFSWGHGGRSPLDILETIGHGCTFIDYDGDGLPDILLVGNRKCALYHNLGNGKFEDVSKQSGLNIQGALCGVTVGDFDNDGYPDVYITGYGSCALYHNRGTSRSQVGKGISDEPIFEDVTAKAGVGPLGPCDFVTAAAFVDLDGDGRLDLIAARYVQFTRSSVRFCKYNGVETGCGVKNYAAASTHVYRNEGDGKFKDVTQQWGFGALHGRCLGLAVGWGQSGPVVYASNDELPCDLMVKSGNTYRNIGQASGTAYGRDGMTQAGMGADWGDVDNDGKMDLVVATFQGEPKSLYRAESESQFTDAAGPLGLSFNTVPYIAWTVKFLDYDNDGWLDLFITNGHVQDNAGKVEPGRTYAQPLQLFHNDAGKQLKLVGPDAGFGPPIVGRGASIGDYDNDGRLDLLVVNEEGQVQLLHNQSAHKTHWLGIKLVGKRSNRDGMGARVRVAAGGKAYTRDQQLCGGYLSGQDARLHFGLGDATKIDRIDVTWPDSQVDTVQGGDRRLAVDQYVTVEEGG